VNSIELRPIFAHYQRKTLAGPRIAVHFETEAFFKQRLQHGIYCFLRSAMRHLGFDIEALI
jgi:hypothetical protein